MSFEKTMEEICFHAGVYQYHDKLKKKQEIIKILNGIVEPYKADQIYLLSASSDESILYYAALSAENQEKLRNIRSKYYRVYGIREQLFFRAQKEKNIRCIIDASVNPPIKRFIRKIVLQLTNQCKVINIYDVLRSKGYVFKAKWYSGLGITYQEICMDYKQFLTAKGEEKILLIKKLIGEFLSIRDFLNAEKWVCYLEDECGSQNKTSEQYRTMWQELRKCLEEMRERLRDVDHIVVNWIDALRLDELSNMSYLNSQMRGGIWFENMYAATPYTSGALRTLFTGKYLIDDRAFELSLHDYQNEKLMNVLRKYDYQFLCSSPCFMDEVFCDENTRLIDSLYERRELVPSTLIQFDALCKGAEVTKKSFILIHNLSETHYPYWNPYTGEKLIDNMDFEDNIKTQEFLRQVRDSQEYLDTQLKYYGAFWKSVRYRIFLSDHGQTRGEKPICVEGLDHTIFSICGRQVETRKVDGITSQIMFSQYIEKCLQNRLEELEQVYCKDYVWVQLDDVYAHARLEKLKKQELPNIMQHLQYRGVITKEDSYIRFVTGEEYYIRNEK